MCFYFVFMRKKRWSGEFYNVCIVFIFFILYIYERLNYLKWKGVVVNLIILFSMILNFLVVLYDNEINIINVLL